MVTMRDVAKAAGVSPMTVSNVVNGHPNVGAETRMRVLETIDHLGYRMNHAARSLRAGRTGIIGLAVPEINQPYFGHLATLLTDRVEREGMRLVVEQTGASREGELDAVFFSRLQLYDGVILSAVGLSDADVSLLHVDYPVVIIGERIFDETLDHVVMANADAAHAATRHLIDLGCRRIAAIGGSLATEKSMPSLRTAGYRRALDEAGIPFDDRLVIACLQTMEDGANAIHHLRDNGLAFDGVFGLTDNTTIGVLRGLADAHLHVPRDVKVIGFDDVPQAQYTIPRLSTIRPGHEEMVDTVVELLLRRINGTATTPREFIAPYQLIARESTTG